MISAEINLFLTTAVSKEEVKGAIMEFSPSKSPGQDGMTAAFYQKN